MSPHALAIAALSSCCAAWLVTAAGLTLDLLGRLPFKRRRDRRSYRLLTTAMLMMLTGAALTQIAGLRHWPGSMRETLDFLDMILALVLMACVVIAGCIWAAPNRAENAEAPRSVQGPAGRGNSPEVARES